MIISVPSECNYKSFCKWCISFSNRIPPYILKGLNIAVIDINRFKYYLQSWSFILACHNIILKYCHYITWNISWVKVLLYCRIYMKSRREIETRSNIVLATNLDQKNFQQETNVKRRSRVLLWTNSTNIIDWNIINWDILCIFFMKFQHRSN